MYAALAKENSFSGVGPISAKAVSTLYSNSLKLPNFNKGFKTQWTEPLLVQTAIEVRKNK